MDEKSASRFEWPQHVDLDPDSILTHEWIVTNGLGGYASGTVAGVATRRYHGALVAALPAPLGRMLVLGHVRERIVLPNGRVVRLGGDEPHGGALELPDALRDFHLDLGLPVWTFAFDGFVVEKRLFVPYRQNTVHLRYRVLSGDGARLRLSLEPSVHVRNHDGPVGEPLKTPYLVTAIEGRYEVAAGSWAPPLRMYLMGESGSLRLTGGSTRELAYRVERSRGYDWVGPVWSPGPFEVDLATGAPAALIGSTEDWATILAMHPDEVHAAEVQRREALLAHAHPAARNGVAGELVLAADQFVIAPATRVGDAARAHAAGDEPRTVIAGYHWFTDWGRDTMISLEGLTLTTGRHAEAGYILRTFAHYVRDGLMPNHFPEGENDAIYNTADATLWFFHAVHRYYQHTRDRETLALLLPVMRDIVAHHIRGTRFGVGVDPADGLLRQGADGYQLTWMDAKVGDWVVTPRRGKAVEINALFYNALRILAEHLDASGDAESARGLDVHADRVRRSFDERFWYEAGGYLYDVVDGEQCDDAACRPNQLLAISLDYPVLERARWDSVIDVVTRELLTPLGLRSLSRDHPEYKPAYYGDLRARDAAYHQGTVWGWLVGPYVDAVLKAHPEGITLAKRALEGFARHMGEACIGQISEIFDADPPFTARGCIAQAWSVAEVLRSYVQVRELEMRAQRGRRESATGDAHAE